MNKKIMFLFVCLNSITNSNAFAAKLEYFCANKKIDEDASYYLSKYRVTIDTTSKKAIFKDKDNEVVSDGAIKLKKSISTDPHLVGALKGTMWSDGGCAVEAYITAEMMAGEERAFIKVKQELECRGPGAWLSCVKL